MNTTSPLGRMRTAFVAIALELAACLPEANSTPFKVSARIRQGTDQSDRAPVVYRDLELESTKTAVIVCDMWDQHWCKGATARVAEMAPHLDRFLKQARTMGMLIIHAPSGTMNSYKDFPQRRRAERAKQWAKGSGLNSWRPLDKTREGALPIDDSDGGCDDLPQCIQGNPWQKQIEAIEITDADFISDNGEEILGLINQKEIENVILVGVHANMCVLGRPFGIRAMVGHGKRVFLVRDLTDTMYNSRKRPFVNHFSGTDLVVEHIEKHWCPTITSTDILGGRPFRFAADDRPTVVMVIAENEYRTWETLPAFASSDLLKAGLRTEYVVAGTRPDDFQFKNYRAIEQADLVLVSVRRRAMPAEMARLLKCHLEAGKPVVGIRTASHAFALRGPDKTTLAHTGLEDWPDFDARVLGGNYSGHHPAGRTAIIRVSPGVNGHPILAGIDPEPWPTIASLYKTRPLKPSAQALLIGQIEGEEPEPVAWVNIPEPSKSRVFYTSLGHPEDFANPKFRTLLKQGILWALGRQTSTH